MIEKSISEIESPQDSPIENQVNKEEYTYIRDQMRSFKFQEFKEIPQEMSNRGNLLECHIIRDTMVSFKL